jgi:AcrR family transcriptional regulator
VSKGGLLYHFASKDALAAGLLARLRERSAADADAIRAAADGATAYYLSTSAPGGGIPGGLTRTYLAALRAGEHARDPAAVRDALAAVDADALAALGSRLGDPALAWLVQLIGDGLYLRTLIGTPLPPGLDVSDVLALLRPHLPPGEAEA